MRPTRPALFAASLALLLPFLASIAEAAKSASALNTTTRQAQSRSTAPTIQVYSRETVVDVIVTDADGKPVHGLKQSDFTVREDGKEQTLRSFKEFNSGSPADTSSLRKLPPNTYTNLDDENGPLYVLLFDDINGNDGTRVRRAAASFIKNLAPGTRVAILALGNSFTVLQGPTTDRDLLLQRVNTPVATLSVQAVACVKQVALDWATIDQLKQVATYFSAVKGRKNLIWISNSISDMVFGQCQLWTQPLQNTYDLLENAQVTVFPLDPGGVHPMGEGQLAMEAVAEATGGVAYYERNDLGTLMAKVVDDGSSYYTLSYASPINGYDGKYHAIGIKVDVPSVHLRYRKGYSSEDPALLEHPPEKVLGMVNRQSQPIAPPANPLIAAISPIAPPSTQLLFDVNVAPSTEEPNPFDPPVMGQINPKFRKAPLTRYTFLFAVPVSEVAFADALGAVRNGSVEFDVAAYDPDGNLASLQSQTLKLPLTTEEYKQFIQTPFRFFEQIDLPPGPLTLRVGILDGVSNKVGTLEIPLTVPKTPAQQATTRPAR